MLGPAGRGTLFSVESRAELSAAAAARAAHHGHERFRFVEGTIESARAGGALPERVHVVTALHACDTATDDALALAVARGAEHIAVVPCCQAEVARQLAAGKDRDAADQALVRHPLHRRELGSHLTNVVRGLSLEAHGYHVTVTELVGWEHAMKNEILIARKHQRTDRIARETLARLLGRWKIEPATVTKLREAGFDPLAA